MIEEKIKNRQNWINGHSDMLDINYVIGYDTALNWILKELKKMICENCKIQCRLRREKYFNKKDYCSYWEQK